MNRQQLLDFHQLMSDASREIMKVKNHDYTGKNGDDPFANFRRVEALGICSTEQGFLVRLADKLSRLSTFVQNGTLLVKDETVKDTLLDIMNYAVLFGAYLENKDANRTSAGT